MMTQFQVWWFPASQVRILCLVEREGEFGAIAQLRVLSWPGSKWWWMDRARARARKG